MNRDELARRIESMKGLAGSGNVLSRVIEEMSDMLRTMEPGDIAGHDKASAVPIAYDLWYLWYNKNFLQKYYANTGADFKHYNYSTYLGSMLSFLNYLTGLKPLKVYTDLEAQFNVNDLRFESVWSTKQQYVSNGIYWINTMFFELMQKGGGIQYPSNGSPRYKTNVNDYVGYFAFPIGQLGVMEVISMFQETDIRGYQFAKVDSLSTYHAKPAPGTIKVEDTPTVQSTPLMFPDMKTPLGAQLAGLNYCYGKHLIEDAYVVANKITPFTKADYPSVQEKLVQNTLNSEDKTAYAPLPSQDLELWASNIKDYGEEIAPKKWMRWWLHKDSVMPVPGEFIGILCRPVATPPHVWWFQESAPFLYAGNWVETTYFTSGIVQEVTLEAARTDGGVGNLYKVQVQGVEILLVATDFLLYSAGDRVALMKTTTTSAKSFTANNQVHLQSGTSALVINTEYIIVPITFYKIKH
jgi:hypothetical protein